MRIDTSVQLQPHSSFLVFLSPLTLLDIVDTYNQPMTSIGTKLKTLFTAPIHALRSCFAEWVVLMPAKSDLDDEYTFPQTRWAGQGRG